MAETREVTIAGRRFSLGRPDVEARLAEALPEPVLDHFVVIGGRRYPPKQVIGLLTDLERADFTTHHARRILRGLGFPVGRRHDQAPAPPRPPSERAERRADALRPFMSQWVALRGDDVLVAAPSAREVVGWLTRHDQRADTMFRVPADDLRASGLARA